VPAETLVRLPAGSFLMGGREGHPADREGPVRRVGTDAYAIAAHAVTVARFAAFAGATGHVTTAEREGWSFVFAGQLAAGHPPTRAMVGAPWWRQVHGASWRAPEGPGSDVAARADHPVVHVSHDDAVAFCAWAGRRLPTEAEWERAARGGHEGRRFPWGDELEPGGEHRANVFQGEFPVRDTAADGFAGTAPVDAYAPNDLGLFCVVGNVWEWCAGWFAPGRRAQRGGSYLCHASYCTCYRLAARTGAPPDATSGNIGFRVAADA
jgi:formylglycine-generating enzyme required for sulfatase activity